MKRFASFLVLVAASSFAAESIDVPLNGRTPLMGKKAIDEITVRDPSLVLVVVTDGAVSLEGKKNGVSGVLVKYADGELERRLVVVGDSFPDTKPRIEREQRVDLKPLKSATAQKKPARSKGSRDRESVWEAAGAVRSAVERL